MIATQEAIPRRGPTAYHGRGQYYDVVNHFFRDGKQVRRFEHFKRIGDKQGWGSREWREGLELDRCQFLYDWKLSQVGARLAELVADGCEVLSYKKLNAPGDMVSYLLVSWPTNAELERNRSARVGRKQSKQASLPKSITPFQHPQPYRTAGPLKPGQDWYTVQTGKPRPPLKSESAFIDLPLFAESKP